MRFIFLFSQGFLYNSLLVFRKKVLICILISKTAIHNRSLEWIIFLISQPLFFKINVALLIFFQSSPAVSDNIWIPPASIGNVVYTWNFFSCKHWLLSITYFGNHIGIPAWSSHFLKHALSLRFIYVQRVGILPDSSILRKNVRISALPVTSIVRIHVIWSPIQI